MQTFSELIQKHLVYLPLFTGSQPFNPFPCDDRSRSDQRHSSSRPKICTRWSIPLLCFFCLPVALFGQAALTSPVPGSQLSGPIVTFTWTAGSGVISYQLYVGTSGAGSDNLYDSGPTAATSVSVTGLPIYGQTVYARLFSDVAGTWTSVDYTYTASGSPVPAAMSTPAPGSVLSGPSVTFTWTAGGGVNSYMLYVGTSGVGSDNLYDSGHTRATSASLTDLPI